ncbi:substrate-binding domain-containing protein [Pseudonocardia yunnanensis]
MAAGLFSAGSVYIAIALTLAAIALVVRLYVSRKRLSFEEDFNSKIGIVPFGHNNDPAATILSVFNSVSVVVIRVWNSGRATIEADDYRRALRFVVRGRYILDFRLSQPQPDDLRSPVEKDAQISAVVTDSGTPPPFRSREDLLKELPESLLSPDAEHKNNSRELRLPRLKLRPRDEFRLVVALREDEKAPPEGRRLDKGYEFDGELHSGKLIDHGAPRRRPSANQLLVGAVAVLAVMLVLALFVRPMSPEFCADGELRIVGSSAIEPTVRAISDGYRASCGGARFSLDDMDGSLEGIRELQDKPDERQRLLAFSDGPANGPTGQLDRHPVAVLVYALVVNRAAGIQSLTTDQVRQINAGTVRNWSELGGADVPIRLVGRGPDSGSRQAFESHVLGGAEAPVSSNSCYSNDRVPDAPVIRCERSTTTELLTEVDRVEGAIGYSDAAPAAQFGRLIRLRLDGAEPTREYLETTYKFWTVEYVYTNGVPEGEGLLNNFVDYLAADPAARHLQDAAYVPCVGSDRSIAQLCLIER